MFKWLKRRMVREHQKLVWQNGAAATDPELRTRLLFSGRHDLVDAIDEIASVAADMIERGVPAKGLPSGQCEIGLRINKELRRLFETAYRAPATQFDPKYTPLGGWDLYYERKDEGV